MPKLSVSRLTASRVAVPRVASPRGVVSRRTTARVTVPRASRVRFPAISLPCLLALGMIVALGGCDSSPTASNPYDEDTRPEDLTYAPALVELGVDFDEMTQTATGLWYRDFVVGTGAEASVGDNVSVEYTGWLPDGTQFDTGTYDFELESGNVIEGWVEGLEGVRVGGHRLLVIPWWAAYGRSGAGGGVIPPYAPLVFEVELVAVDP